MLGFGFRGLGFRGELSMMMLLLVVPIPQTLSPKPQTLNPKWFPKLWSNSRAPWQGDPTKYEALLRLGKEALSGFTGVYRGLGSRVYKPILGVSEKQGYLILGSLE